jgi:hypothetical protein
LKFKKNSVLYLNKNCIKTRLSTNHVHMSPTLLPPPPLLPPLPPPTVPEFEQLHHLDGFYEVIQSLSERVARQDQAFEDLLGRFLGANMAVA